MKQIPLGPFSCQKLSPSFVSGERERESALCKSKPNWTRSWTTDTDNTSRVKVTEQKSYSLSCTFSMKIIKKKLKPTIHDPCEVILSLTGYRYWLSNWFSLCSLHFFFKKAAVQGLLKEFLFSKKNETLFSWLPWKPSLKGERRMLKSTFWLMLACRLNGDRWIRVMSSFW